MKNKINLALNDMYFKNKKEQIINCEAVKIKKGQHFPPYVENSLCWDSNPKILYSRLVKHKSKFFFFFQKQSYEIWNNDGL